MLPWRRNLYLLWFCSFIIMAGFTAIMPFLPYHLAQIGVGSEEAVQFWSGLIIAGNFVTMAVFAPIWGAMADRVGRRPQMLRSGFGMAATVALMGLTGSVSVLFGLRLIQGVFSGFIPSAVAFVAATAPSHQTGYALGLLQSGAAAGNIVGPLLGGILAKLLGAYRPIFFITALSCVLAAGLVMIFIREDFKPPASAAAGTGSPLADFREMIGNRAILAMVVVYFLNFLAIMTVEPVLSLFLQKLDTPAQWVELAAGAVFSSSAFANVLTAPVLGRYGDRFGHRRILIASLGASVLFYALQATVTAAWQLLVLRFLVGACLGGIMTSASSLVARYAGAAAQGRAFGLTNTAVYVGMVFGPLIGGAVAATVGQRAVFLVSALVVIANLVWIWRAVPADDRPRAAQPTQATQSALEQALPASAASD